MYVNIFLFCAESQDLRTSSLSFITDKLVMNCQNFSRVRLQLKFAFIIRP